MTILVSSYHAVQHVLKVTRGCGVTDEEETRVSTHSSPWLRLPDNLYWLLLLPAITYINRNFRFNTGELSPPENGIKIWVKVD